MDEFRTWLEYGMNKGWCSTTYCYVHEGIPMSEEESEILFESDDACVHIIRLYESPEQKEEVEFH